jgi:hypothetical protein
VNNRSLTRGDAVVIGAAVLLFIASFLDIYTVDLSGFGGGGTEGTNAWEPDLFPILPSLFFTGILGAVGIAASRFVKQPERKFAALTLEQWGIALCAVSAWTAFWTIVGGPEQYDTGAGLILGLIAALVLAAAAIATPLVPALKLPLSGGGAPRPAGFPGAQPPFGAQPQQPGYGYPNAPAGAQPAAYQATQAAPVQPGSDFQPFWFAVPATRPLFDEGNPQAPIAELTPGTWYLAVEQRGQTLVAQTQDGRRGVLQDTSGIQRG